MPANRTVRYVREWFRLAVLTTIIGAAAAISAQPAFRSSVDLATVPVTVIGSDPTRRLGELQPSDFRLYEDGVRQEVSVVSHQPRPLSICILGSPSTRPTRHSLCGIAAATSRSAKPFLQAA
ncbi:MAG TPA: hypothetical protein VNJ02_03075 [Vicinamibacterales bacterium]|nr:hypothetical protein [Vicinamibacterales bacterium]